MFLFTTQTVDSSNTNVVDQATEQLSAWQKYWQTINWDRVFSVLIQKGLTILAVIVLFYLIRKIGNFLIDQSFERQKKKIADNATRIETIHALSMNIFSYTLFFFFLYSILDTLGIPVGSLLAGAGIAGIAIGLGAQGFTNDIITGFFIIMEQQIDVGDYIRLTDLSIEGTVTSVGIRMLQMKSADGTVHFIPNRNITTISNLSRAHMQVKVDVRIQPNEGYDKISHLIEEANQKLAEEFNEEIFDGPTLFGMVDLGNSNYAIRTILYVTNGKQYKLQEEFLTAYVKILNQNGFTIPNNPIAIGK
ncbi:mechanosensitive ion channel family protein [Enterococcus hulanensis]|uniref:Mechanosensitive ion channel family protein n=1 Tax=Enterococcus hulanensis TaxID=2559929 RepID=A0ABU3EXU3_9ENTE|nr:mechanosensitive ion channel family protein [Enterococcus hulanensis]MDT2599699.1 mechanosensitive ion channel family protein [Enterococcus hulanensis]MDT2609445.1 mechanosensitive ion channel family protein [Enterococcus hulanensis]MDT2616022.1 mechanosensitive ion channel family protein [Enterococcus hulanensis]MDT2627938.1 mechanosensitive ion channel family protein [Enterococcus hulanensis]MDT2655043.1 mechanosensitive ion channel family protein [Enterococcus hulanensis]